MSSRYIASVLALSLIGCSQVADTWTASVYPNRDNLRHSVTLGAFSSRIGCAAAAVDVLDHMGALAQGDYECGLRCKPHDRLAVLICETTEKPIDLRAFRPGEPALASLHEKCMARVEHLHRFEYLTYKQQIKAWLSLGDPDELRRYAEFAEAVKCLSVTSTDMVPQLGMSPTVFEVHFDGHSERIGAPYRLSD